MAEQIVVIDTSILIDYFRKTDKIKSIWIQLLDKGYTFYISSITEYEVLVGATIPQLTFWNDVLKNIGILSLDHHVVKTAVEITKTLKKKRKQIDLADILIAATAVSGDLPLATLNKKHFERIEGLKIID